MKKSFIITIAAVSILTFSCKKESTNDTGNNGNNDPSVSKIKTAVGGSGTYSYTYDASGRVLSKENSNGTKSTYEYQPGKVIQKVFNSAGVNTQIYQYELGNDGLAIQLTRPLQPDYLETKIFNAEKQIIKNTVTQNGATSVFDYFYTNGNCDSTRCTYNGNWSATIKRTFYTDKSNGLDYSNYGSTFFGKSDKNLIKSEQVFYNDGSTNNKDTWTYEFDAAGRVSKQTGTAGNNIDITYYTYY